MTAHNLDHIERQIEYAMDQLSTHPFSPANIAAESGALTIDEDRLWMRWINRVEQIVGHDMDGDQEADGYSLDFAYDAWRAGQTPDTYAKSIA